MHLEYWARVPGNSGISIRDPTRAKYALTQPADYQNTPAHNGYEVQIVNGERPGKWPTGSIYLFAPAQGGEVNTYDWNKIEIQSRNDVMRVKVNGKVVVEHPGDPALFRRLEKLGEQAAKRWNQPDAGLWELRKRNSVHTYSSVMCWAACDRLAKIAARLELSDRAAHWSELADTMREEILQRSWSPQANSIVATFDGEDVDAALLLLPQIGFIDADDPRYVATVDRIEKDLLQDRHLRRYSVPDDMGVPEVAFNACTFWYIDALAALGREDEARDLFEGMLAQRNPLGLLSEDINPKTGELWGNFPQTYSMVGLIHSAMRLSRPWEDAF